VFVATFAVAVGWLVVNALHWLPAMRYGALAVAAGGLLNGVAIAANGRMPLASRPWSPRPCAATQPRAP
jgi:hypothetical protein